jgi:hypothetical protein
MATSERSFADRHARAQLLQSTIAGFTPSFTPQDANLSPSAFQSYINGVEAANDAVDDADAVFSPLVESRIQAAEAVKEKALRVKDYVSSNVAWKKYFKSVASAADAVRGYRIAKKSPAPAPGSPSSPATKARQGARSQQGFGDLEKLYGKLVIQIGKIVGYTAPAGSGLLKADLDALDASYAALNNSIAAAEADLTEAQRIRKDYYDGENGLKEKMKCIKMAVRSQYGINSTQYAAVKGIGL